VLATAGIAMTLAEIALEISKTPDATRKLLSRLVQDKFVEKVGHGRYKVHTNITPFSPFGTVGTFGTVSPFVKSIQTDSQERETDTNGVKRIETDSKRSDEFSAVESIKQGQTEQTDIVYKERILTELRKEPKRPDTICAMIGPRSIWAAIRADMNAMLDLDIIAWDGDYLMIPPSA
jgi:hypothetical protein